MLDIPTTIDVLHALRWLFVVGALVLIGWAVYEGITAPEETYPGEYGGISEHDARAMHPSVREARAHWDATPWTPADAEWAAIEAALGDEPERGAA